MKRNELLSKWKDLSREATKGKDTKRLKNLIAHINVLAKPIRDDDKSRKQKD